MSKYFSAASVILLTLFVVSSGQADWTFREIEEDQYGEWCVGEVDGPGNTTGCQITPSWGRTVSTSPYGSYCAASIDCGNGFVKTCLASSTFGFKPPVCWAKTSDNTGHEDEVICKSDLGLYALTCP